jgi:predicted nucleic acid-binding protein
MLKKEKSVIMTFSLEKSDKDKFNKNADRLGVVKSQVLQELVKLINTKIDKFSKAEELIEYFEKENGK